MSHIIPESEKELHVPSAECKCEPKPVVEKETMDIIWQHNYLEPERLIDNLFQI